jgi:hypothetical protein
MKKDVPRRRCVTSAEPSRPRWRRKLIAATIVTFLFVQVGLPQVGLFARGTSLLTGDSLEGADASRFGWQMFSVVTSIPVEYEVELADGSTAVVDSQEHFGTIRGRMHYDASLVRDVCAVHPGSVAVVHDEVRHAC